MMVSSFPRLSHYLPGLAIAIVFVVLQIVLSSVELSWIVASSENINIASNANPANPANPGVSVVILLLIGIVYLVKYSLLWGRWERVKELGTKAVQEWRSALMFVQRGEDLLPLFHFATEALEQSPRNWVSINKADVKDKSKRVIESFFEGAGVYDKNISHLTPSDQFGVMLRVLVSLMRGADIVDGKENPHDRIGKGSRKKKEMGPLERGVVSWELQMGEGMVNSPNPPVVDHLLKGASFFEQLMTELNSFTSSSSGLKGGEKNYFQFMKISNLPNLFFLTLAAINAPLAIAGFSNNPFVVLVLALSIFSLYFLLWFSVEQMESHDHTHKDEIHRSFESLTHSAEVICSAVAVRHGYSLGNYSLGNTESTQSTSVTLTEIATELSNQHGVDVRISDGGEMKIGGSGRSGGVLEASVLAPRGSFGAWRRAAAVKTNVMEMVGTVRGINIKSIDMGNGVDGVVGRHKKDEDIGVENIDVLHQSLLRNQPMQFYAHDQHSESSSAYISDDIPQRKERKQRISREKTLKHQNEVTVEKSGKNKRISAGSSPNQKRSSNIQSDTPEQERLVDVIVDGENSDVSPDKITSPAPESRMVVEQELQQNESNDPSDESKPNVPPAPSQQHFQFYNDMMSLPSYNATPQQSMALGSGMLLGMQEQKMAVQQQQQQLQQQQQQQNLQQQMSFSQQFHSPYPQQQYPPVQHQHINPYNGSMQLTPGLMSTPTMNNMNSVNSMNNVMYPSMNNMNNPLVSTPGGNGLPTYIRGQDGSLHPVQVVESLQHQKIVGSGGIPISTPNVNRATPQELQQQRIQIDSFEAQPLQEREVSRTPRGSVKNKVEKIESVTGANEKDNKPIVPPRPVQKVDATSQEVPASSPGWNEIDAKEDQQNKPATPPSTYRERRASKNQNTSRSPTPSYRERKEQRQMRSKPPRNVENDSPSRNGKNRVSSAAKPLREFDELKGEDNQDNVNDDDSGWKPVPISSFVPNDPLNKTETVVDTTKTSLKVQHEKEKEKQKLQKQQENQQKQFKKESTNADHQEVEKLKSKESAKSVSYSRGMENVENNKPHFGFKPDEREAQTHSVEESESWPEPAEGEKQDAEDNVEATPNLRRSNRNSTNSQESDNAKSGKGLGKSGLTPLRAEISPRFWKGGEDRLHLRETRKVKRSSAPTRPSTQTSEETVPQPTAEKDNGKENDLVSNTQQSIQGTATTAPWSASQKSLQTTSVSGAADSESPRVKAQQTRAIGSLRDHYKRLDEKEKEQENHKSKADRRKNTDRSPATPRTGTTPRTPRAGNDLNPDLLAARRLAGRAKSPRVRQTVRQLEKEEEEEGGAGISEQSLLAAQYAGAISSMKFSQDVVKKEKQEQKEGKTKTGDSNNDQNAKNDAETAVPESRNPKAEFVGDGILDDNSVSIQPDHMNITEGQHRQPTPSKTVPSSFSGFGNIDEQLITPFDEPPVPTLTPSNLSNLRRANNHNLPFDKVGSSFDKMGTFDKMGMSLPFASPGKDSEDKLDVSEYEMPPLASKNSSDIPVPFPEADGSGSDRLDTGLLSRVNSEGSGEQQQVGSGEQQELGVGLAEDQQMTQKIPITSHLQEQYQEFSLQDSRRSSVASVNDSVVIPERRSSNANEATRRPSNNNNQRNSNQRSQQHSQETQNNNRNKSRNIHHPYAPKIGASENFEQSKSQSQSTQSTQNTHNNQNTHNQNTQNTNTGGISTRGRSSTTSNSSVERNISPAAAIRDRISKALPGRSPGNNFVPLGGRLFNGNNGNTNNNASRRNSVNAISESEFHTPAIYNENDGNDENAQEDDHDLSHYDILPVRKRSSDIYASRGSSKEHQGGQHREQMSQMEYPAEIDNIQQQHLNKHPDHFHAEQDDILQVSAGHFSGFENAPQQSSQGQHGGSSHSGKAQLDASAQKLSFLLDASFGAPPDETFDSFYAQQGGYGEQGGERGIGGMGHQLGPEDV